VLAELEVPDAFVLNDRFFVVMEGSPGLQQGCADCARPSATQAPAAWLIDAHSGDRAELTWRDEPTTMNADEQSLLVSDGRMSVLNNVVRGSGESPTVSELFLPLVIDGRDGTIRPLVVPDDASPDVPVMQAGTGRIWVGTTPDPSRIGLAYSDDGGATWTDAPLPAPLRSASFDVDHFASYGDQELSIAAEGDRVAIVDSWGSPKAVARDMYISADAGSSWSTVTVANPGINGSHVYVLADQRLLLVQSNDPYTVQLVVSTGSDWTKLEPDAQASEVSAGTWLSVNRAGIVARYYPNSIFGDGSIGGMPDAPSMRYQFSDDLTSWQTIAVLDD
jgi:hypothetical protein